MVTSRSHTQNNSHVICFDLHGCPTRGTSTIQKIPRLIGKLIKGFLSLLVKTIVRIVFLGLFFALLITALTVVFTCILIISLATLPLLLVCLLITRTFQFIKYGYSYKKLTNFKHLIRGWLYIDVLVVCVGLLVFYPIAKFVPSIKQVILLNLLLTRWVQIIGIVCGFYLVSYVIYSFTHQATLSLNFRSVNIAQAFSEIIDGLIFWWAAHHVMRRVPTFAHHEILGLPTRKWVRVSILVLIGYNLITLFTNIAVISLRHICQPRPQVTHQNFWQSVLVSHLHKKYIVYFANGMKLSISFIMSSLLLLLTWVLYFGYRLDMKIAKVNSIYDYVFWTLLCLLICSFLWLIKTFVLLAWEVQTIYERLSDKIVDISEQLYFLGILGRTNAQLDIFKLRPNVVEDRGKDKSWNIKARIYHVIPQMAWKKFNFEKRGRIKNELLDVFNYYEDRSHITVDDLQTATRYFIIAKKCLSKENYISGILSPFKSNSDDVNSAKLLLDKLRSVHRESPKEGVSNKDEQKTSSGEENNGSHQETSSGEENSDNQETSSVGENSDFKHFVTKLLKQPGDSSVPFNDIQTWVETAHRDCMYLANTLSSAEEVADCLNIIISWLLIGAAFIMWLLLTGLATTQVLVLIASPLLAATFIFGNTCKTLFEGILFVYVIHPLDVGDICLIETDMMEVMAIGIWTTTFTRVGKLRDTQEVVIYPNSELVSKVIINHKTMFDWSDCVETHVGVGHKSRFSGLALNSSLQKSKSWS